MAEISGRSKGAVKLHNVGDNPMRVENMEWSLIDSSIILETCDNNGAGKFSCSYPGAEKLVRYVARDKKSSFDYLI